MKKRFLSVGLALCLLLGLLPVTATAEDAHTHDGVTFTPWTATDSLPTGAGNYYLTEDVTLTGTWTVPSGDNTLCLNGHSVTYDGSADVITVPAGAGLTLTDCVEGSTGRVAYTGSGAYYGVSNKGTFTLASGAVEGYWSVYNNSNATFTMTGGTVTTSGTSGYGVYNSSSTSVFKLSGGSVSGGKYGVYNFYSASQLYLSGAPAVHGGTADICVYVDADSACVYADDGAEENPVAYSGEQISLKCSSLKNGYTTVHHVTSGTKDKFVMVESEDDPYELVYDESAGTLKIQGKPQTTTWHGIDNAPLSGEGYPATLPYETELFPADLPAGPAVEGKLFLCWQYSTDGGETWEKIDDYDGLEVTGPVAFHAVYADAFPGGSGTADDPYQIASAADLQNLAVIVSSGGEVCNNSKVWYQLTADIDLAAVCGPDVGSWTPIGSSSYPFRANLDGNGKTISNLYISGSYDAGLFGYIDSDEYDEEAEEYVAVQIRDLTLTDVSVSGGNDVGALAGGAYHVNLSGCAVTGSMTGNNSVGGLVGNGYDTRISGCAVNGSVVGDQYVGGLVGSGYSMEISGCAVSGTVTGREYVGALTGYNNNNTTENNDTTGVTVVTLPPEDYTVDSTQTMAYKADNTNAIDVKGRYNGAWLKTTYADNGYEVATSGLDSATVTAKADFINSGRYVKLSYTVTAGTEAVSGGKLAVHADIQIGENDSAAVEAILNAEGQAVGLKMVDDNEGNNSCGSQFNLYFAGTGGVTDVSTYWFGKYYDREEANDTYGYTYFAPLNDDTKSTSTSAVYEKNDAGVYTKLSGVDSGFAISWQGIELAAGESKTYSLVLGVGAKSDPPRWDASDPLSLTLETDHEGRILHVTAQVSDAPGLTDTLYYCVDDGPEQELGSVLADGQTEFIFGTVDLTDYEPGTYTFSFWVVNSAGAASTSVDKVVIITADGVEGVDPPPAEDPNTPTAHLHSWAVGWTANETHHWHQCQTEGCAAADSEKYGYAAHVPAADKAVAATCTEKGKTAGSHCEICGYVIAAQEETALAAHTWNSGTVTIPATCTAKGVRTYTCTVCGATKTEEIAATGHTYNGYEHDETHHWQVCSVCSAETTKATHTWDSGEVTTEPTYAADGVKTYSCTVCGQTKTEVVPMLTHNFSNDWTSDASDHWHICTDDDCDAISDKTAHVPATDEAVAATCTEKGKTAGSHCEICGYVITTQTEIPATGHSWNDGEVTIPTTCTETGVRTYICTVCTATKTEDIDPTGHTYGADWQSDETGHWHECACGEKTAKEAHVFDDDQDTDCDICGYARTVTPPSPGGITPVAPGERVIAEDGTTVENKEGVVTVTDPSGGETAIALPDGGDGSVEVDRATGEVSAPAGSTVTTGGTSTTITEGTATVGADGAIRPPKGGAVTTETGGATTHASASGDGSVIGEVVVKPQTPKVTAKQEALRAVAGTPEGSQTVTITLTVEKLDAPADKTAIDTAASAQAKNLTYLDMTLTKTTTDAGSTPTTETIADTGNEVLEIVIPFDFTGKTNVTAYRKHDSKAEALTKADTKADGTFRLDEPGGKVYIYASKFSTYAIGYTAVTAELDPAPSGSRRRYVAAQTKLAEETSAADPVCPKDITCPIAQFTDTDPAVWYHDGVHYCVETGLMVGTSETTFAPAMTTSRAMIATILWRQAGSPVVNYALQYDDVKPDTWYTEAIRWATAQGVVNGYGNGKFGPDDPITREQLAAMLYRYAQTTGRDVSVGEDTNILSYKDFDQIGEWVIPALQWAAGSGIVQGKGGGVLDPQGQATRAEAASMLQRFCEMTVE